jgi:hypothetical protein
MLLTLTLNRPPATDLGYLLHKHPERVQQFALPFGAAHVFFPEVNEERCTAALLLDLATAGLLNGSILAGSYPPLPLIGRGLERGEASEMLRLA